MSLLSVLVKLINRFSNKLTSKNLQLFKKRNQLFFKDLRKHDPKHLIFSHFKKFFKNFFPRKLPPEILLEIDFSFKLYQKIKEKTQDICFNN